MLVPLLVWCSLDLFQCCVFILLLWSTKLIFYTWYKSISWSFISWTLFWYLSFLTAILKIEKPHDCVFTDFARSIMVSAVYLFHFLDFPAEPVSHGLPGIWLLLRDMVWHRLRDFLIFPRFRNHLISLWHCTLFITISLLQFITIKCKCN